MIENYIALRMESAHLYAAVWFCSEGKLDRSAWVASSELHEKRGSASASTYA